MFQDYNSGFYRKRCPKKHERCVSPLPDCIDRRLDQQGVSLNYHYILDVPVFINTDRHNDVSDDARRFRLRRIDGLDLMD